MSHRQVGIAASVGLALLGAALTHAQSRGNEVASPPRVAHSAQSPAERCTSLSALMIQDARAALNALGAPPVADFDAIYRRELRNFDATCAALTPEQLSCLETARNAIDGVGSCGVNEGKDFNSRVNPPMLASRFVTWQAHNHEARSEATTREAIAQLTGTWRLADRWSEQSFTVAAGGTATYVSTRAGQTETRQGTVDVLSPTHIKAMMGSATFDWGFFVDGNRVLLSNQTGTGAYPIAPRGVTRAAFNGHFFLFDSLGDAPSCRGYGPRLEPIALTCAWDGSGDARKLVVTVAARRGIESGTNSIGYPIRFVVRRNHLIPDGDAMFWTRVTSP